MEKTLTVKALKQLISESSNEFHAVLGPNVEKDNKSINGKAYSDAKKRAKDYDGGLDNVGGKRAEYVKNDTNKTTLDYEPENVSDNYKKRIKAQAEGYTSVAEKENGIEKASDFSDNENIYNAIKKSGQEMHKGEKEMKKSGLQGSKWPDKIFDKEEMYESKEGFDMKQMINRMRILQENFDGSLDNFYKEEDESAPGENEYNDDFMSRVKNAQAGTKAQGLMEHKNIKTVYFKKTEFLTEGHMLSRIPDEFKNEGEQFRMKDKKGNSYLIEWKNNKGIIKEHKNTQGFNESLNRMKDLYSYSSKNTETSMKSRLNEESNFKSTLNNARNIK